MRVFPAASAGLAAWTRAGLRLAARGGPGAGARGRGERAAGGQLRGGPMLTDTGQLGLPRLPGFREMALRRMAAGRRRLVGELTAQRQGAGLSQTQVAARMGTSQSAVARLEGGG